MCAPRSVVRAAFCVGVILVFAAARGLGPVGAAYSPFSTDPVLSADAVNQINASLDRSVMRSRLVALNVTTLPDPRVRPQLSREPALSFELFPDVFIVAVFDRFDSNATGVTWVGHVENVPGSSVTLVYGNRLMLGSIVMPLGTFQIRPAPEDVRAANRQAAGEVHVITQVDQAALLREADPIIPTLSSAAVEAAQDVAMADTADVIDVMVLYTTLAQTAAGGPEGIINLINVGISETNTTYANSDIRQRVRLVHTAMVPYVEVSAFSTNLSNLRAGEPGLESVALLRDQYRADLVMLLVHPPSPDFCGIAYVMTNVTTAFAQSGVSITDTACVSPGLTMAHEWGHNMGAQHDWYMNASRLPYSYAHGFVNWKPGQRWRTVMAYNDACTVQRFSCTRLLAWANPNHRLTSSFCPGGTFTCQSNLWLLSEPMGLPADTGSNCTTGSITNNYCDADDSRALNNTAQTVANFRQAASSTASDRR
jgi:hypothetical protein